MMHFIANDVRHRRLQSTHLDRQARQADVPRIVDDVCCVQAQILSTAQLALGLRVRNGSQVLLDRAMWRSRSIVKTYGPRSTLHLVSAGNYGLWMAAMREAYGVPKKPDRLTAAIGASLDGAVLTRRELADKVARRLGSDTPTGLLSTWGDHLRAPAFHGLLCFAESSGANVRFARADQWIDGWEAVDGALALREVCRRYVRAYGPTTPSGFARWLLIAPARAEALFEAVRAALVEVTVGRTRAWMEAETRVAGLPKPHVRLVPQYDPYVLNSQPRNAIVPDSARALIKTFGQGRNEGAVGVPVLLVDGEVAGIWRHERGDAQVTVVVDSFVDRDPGVDEAIAREADKVASYYDREADLRFERLARRA